VLKLTDRHELSRGLSATAGLLVVTLPRQYCGRGTVYVGLRLFVTVFLCLCNITGNGCETVAPVVVKLSE